ncbi:MAG: 30S ribosome-binding factor RbfA [Firmicutes bacterium]|nr:30S ribosome-binding factor RbfA [Bacillota bacterium]
MQKIKDPRIGFVTVTEVKVSPDLDLARIFISTLSEGEEREKTMTGLNSAAGFVRKELGKEIKMKKTPKIAFIFDPGIERGSRILQLLNSIKPAEGGDSDDEQQDQEEDI